MSHEYLFGHPERLETLVEEEVMSGGPLLLENLLVQRKGLSFREPKQVQKLHWYFGMRTKNGH